MKERKISYFGYFKILTCNALTDAPREKFLVIMTITCYHNYDYCYNVNNNNCNLI